MAKKKKVISAGATEQMIIHMLTSSWVGEQIRVAFHMREEKAGWLIEVTREIMGEEYSYHGWVSAKVVQTNSEPWPMDQRHMIDRAFQAVLTDLKGKLN